MSKETIEVQSNSQKNHPTFIAMFGISVGGYIALQGHPWSAAFISAIGLSALVPRFIEGRRQSK